MPCGLSASTLAEVADLVAGSEPRCGSTLVVAVDGRSGAGKTTFALALAQVLTAPAGRRGEVPVLHLDHVYPGWDGLAAGVRRLHDLVLVPLSRGERAAYPSYDWVSDRDGDLVDVPPSPLLVVEGAGCSVPPCDAYESVRIWLQARDDTRRTRALVRDGDAYRPHWERWARQETRLFGAHDPRGRAHLVVDTT